jgi:hypothetical protein
LAPPSPLPFLDLPLSDIAPGRGTLSRCAPPRRSRRQPCVADVAGCNSAAPSVCVAAPGRCGAAA